MLAELDRILTDASHPADEDDVRALAALCGFVASECRRLNLETAERDALRLVAGLSQSLARRCH